MLNLILEILVGIGTGVAALAIAGMCLVGLLVWLAGGREDRQQ